MNPVAKLALRVDRWRLNSDSAKVSVPLGELRAVLDKVDGLESDLSNAVETAVGRGAVEWGRLNYPDHPSVRGNNEPPER